MMKWRKRDSRVAKEARVAEFIDFMFALAPNEFSSLSCLEQCLMDFSKTL